VRGKIVSIATFALLVSILASVFATAPAFAENTTVAAPGVVDPTLIPGSSFAINVTVHDVTGMLGYAFRLSYDPSVLTATSFASNDPFIEAWPSVIGAGYVDVAYSWPIPEYFGTDVPPEADPYTMATITFTVLDYGVSPFRLSEVVVTNVFGGWTYPALMDGVFTNILPNVPNVGAEVKFTGAFLGTQRLRAPDVIQTVTTQVEALSADLGGKDTAVYATWVIVDALGAPVAVAHMSALIAAGAVIRLSVDFDTTTWDKPASYTVQFSIEYVVYDGSTGMLVASHHGFGGHTIKTKTFSAE